MRNKKLIGMVFVVVILIAAIFAYNSKPSISPRAIDIQGFQKTDYISLTNSNPNFDCDFTEDVKKLHRDSPTTIRCISKGKWLNLFTVKKDMKVIPEALKIKKTFSEVINSRETIEAIFDQLYDVYLNKAKTRWTQKEDFKYIAVHEVEDGIVFEPFFYNSLTEGVNFDTNISYVDENNIIHGLHDGDDILLKSAMTFGFTDYNKFVYDYAEGLGYVVLVK